jgi:rRNA maturation protein Nop10
MNQKEKFVLTSNIRVCSSGHVQNIPGTERWEKAILHECGKWTLKGNFCQWCGDPQEIGNDPRKVN